MSWSPADSTNELGQPVGWPVEVLRTELPSRQPMVGAYCDLVSLHPVAHTSDLFEAFAEASDDGDWTYLSYGPFASEGDFAAWIDTIVGLDDPMFFTVIDRSTGKAVGLASYLRPELRGAVIEVGHIHFSRRMQKTPMATEAMYLMMRRAFEGGYRRYEWKCDELNAPSQAAARRFGFQYEGRFRQATHYKGRNRNTAWFSILDNEWPALRAEFERWLAADNFDGDGNQRTPLRNRTAEQ